MTRRKLERCRRALVRRRNDVVFWMERAVLDSGRWQEQARLKLETAQREVRVLEAKVQP